VEVLSSAHGAAFTALRRVLSRAYKGNRAAVTIDDRKNHPDLLALIGLDHTPLTVAGRLGLNNRSVRQLAGSSIVVQGELIPLRVEEITRVAGGHGCLLWVEGYIQRTHPCGEFHTYPVIQGVIPHIPV
jgi:hypothetical protein